MKTISNLLMLLCIISPLMAQGAEQKIPEDKDQKTTASGLKYSVLKEGDGGAPPGPRDTVKCHYTGWLAATGKVFDSSRTRGQPLEFQLGGVIKGWGEGLQLVTKGGRIKLTIPSELGYGAQGAGGAIPPNAELIFDVELLDIKRARLPLPDFPVANAEKTVKLDSGLQYEVMAAGDGEKLTDSSTFKMDFSFWDTEKKLIQSTTGNPKPISARISAMSGLPFFKEALSSMKFGSTYRFHVPSNLGLAKGRHPGYPEGTDTIWLINVMAPPKPMKLPEFKLPKAEELQTKPSGLQYEVIKEGTGPSPKANQQVTVHYAGWLTNGTVFDNSYERGEPNTFGVSRLIRGWTEGLQDMKVGGVRRFVIPSALAYGKAGSGPKIGPDSDLVFYVELLGIE